MSTPTPISEALDVEGLFADSPEPRRSICRYAYIDAKMKALEDKGESAGHLHAAHEKAWKMKQDAIQNNQSHA